MTPQNLALRFNYVVQTDDHFAWSSSTGPEDTFGMEADTNKSNISIEEMYFRSERQKLRRLPRTGAIMFTIRTYFLPIVQIAQEQGISGRLASAIRSWPDDVAQHRGKKIYEDVLLKYLYQKHQQQCDQGLKIDNSKSYPY